MTRTKGEFFVEDVLETMDLNHEIENNIKSFENEVRDLANLYYTE